MPAKYTDELRKRLEHIGMEYTKGCYNADTQSFDYEDRVTTVWPVYDESCAALAFRETDDGLECINGEITPYMAVWLATAASLEWERENFHGGMR